MRMRIASRFSTGPATMAPGTRDGALPGRTGPGPALAVQGHLAAQQSGLATMMPRSQLHKMVGPEPAPGILQAVQELSADVLALLDIGHGWVHKLVSDSVIDQVLRATPVPVLLLSAPADFLND